MKKILLFAMGLLTISATAYSKDITCETRKSVTVRDYAMFLKPIVADGFLIPTNMPDDEWSAIVRSIVSKNGKTNPEARLQRLLRYECSNTGKVNHEMHIRAFITAIEKTEI